MLQATPPGAGHIEHDPATPHDMPDLRRVLDNMSDGFFLVDENWRMLYANRRAREMIAAFMSPAEILGRTLWESFPELIGTETEAKYRRAMNGEGTADFELYYAPFAAWFQVRAYLAESRLAICFQDITARKRAEALLAAERDVLNVLAKGAGISEVLHRIVTETETRSVDGMLCSILLLDESGQHLLHGAAPSLPEAYNNAIHGLRIGAGVGSCGTAAFERKPVFVSDIASHPYWAPFQALAREHGLGACCSTPIIASDGQVLGTIAMYYRKPHEPSAQDRELIELAAQLAAVAIQRHRADLAVRRSEEQFRALADSIAQLAWIAEPNGDVVWYNQRWLDYTGLTLQELGGWGWQSVHDPAHVSEVVTRWKQAITAGQPFEMEFPLKGADGRFRWFLSRAIPVLDERGEVTRWFGTNTDVDRERLLRQSLEDERAVLEMLNETGAKLGAKLDIHELVQEITDAGTRLSGAEFGAFFYNTIDARGEAYMLYTLSGAPRSAFEKFGQPRATALFGPTFRGEGVIRLDDVRRDPRYGQSAPHYGMPAGHLPVCSYLAVPVRGRSGEVLGGLFFGHSAPGRFTERAERLIVGIAAQAAVALDNARLYETAQKAARERAALLESEQRARADAERMSEMKDEFLATLSHELRTPLSAILGWTQILGRSGGADAQIFGQAVDTIERNARAQAQLIEDLLDMSRITAGKLRLDIERLQPYNVVSAAIETVLPAANAKGIRIERVLDPAAGPISGDPQRLQQVVWNLLSNAIKFTPRGGKVQVLLARVNSHIEISVADTGAGIKPEFLPYVFERFRQADASTTRSYGGLGLGLSIVKKLVELHGGTVRVASRGEGQGATFTVELPLTVVERIESPQGVHPAAHGVPPDFQPIDLSDVTVLVVDDEEDARNLVEHVLLECHANVLTAARAEDALRLVKERRPNVLVSDIGMPEMDGYALLAAVRKLGAKSGGNLPAIALTAFARSEDRTRALRAGFLVHVAKPVEAGELVATVATVAGRTGGGTPG